MEWPYVFAEYPMMRRIEALKTGSLSSFLVAAALARIVQD
jgi:hypothetical protein